ncbi:MAG: sulfatase-like hydrolase/transferase [Pseudomonadales bacterium]
MTRLRKAGYQSVMVGKWHLGHATSAMLPMARGFEQAYGHFTRGVGYWDHVHGGGLDWHRNGEALREEGYATHLEADEAVRLIRSRDRERTLFLYAAFSAPHLPNEAPGERIDKYRSIENPHRRVHAAMSDGIRSLVSRLVWVFGRPLPIGFLEFLRQNTEDGGSDNGPYRRGKGSNCQGGILVPAVLYWPGTLEPASVSDRVTVQDVLPTLAEDPYEQVDLAGENPGIVEQ